MQNRSPPPSEQKQNNGQQELKLAGGLFCASAFGICCLILICCVIPIIVGIVIVANDNDNNNGGGLGDFNLPRFLPDSSEEVRGNDDFVGVLFGVEPPAAGRDAFVSAAQRWSGIVAGTEEEIGDIGITEGDFFCNEDGDLQFTNSFTLDHLMIIAVIDSIDGPNNILAAAGPCAQQVNGNSFPVVGFMVFDSDDINGLIIDGTFETVVLHEMGHVLGIGTLWIGAVQGSIGLEVLPNGEFSGRLIQDPVNEPFNGLTFSNNRPFFIGDAANEAYQRLGGDREFVPIEDGRIEGQQVFNNAGGAGSVDGHWDKDEFDNEIMTFAVDSNDAEFPMSEITILSLQDLGYTVDITFADDFTVPNSPFKKLTKERLESGTVHVLKNDIFNFQPVKLE